MRKSGILMHITSLPSPYGVGTVGKCAYDFLDFLSQAGQTYWQILPVNPTGYGDSPYQAFSTFAGNHYLIDLDMLIAEGLLKQEEVDAFCWGEDEERVDYGSLYNNRLQVLRLAYDRFCPNGEYDRFVEENRDWLNDYGLFMSLRVKFAFIPWQSWPEALRKRAPEAMESYGEEMQEEIRFHSFLQFQFFRQWDALRRYAEEKGIRIIGDVPIYVPMDSADVWANPGLFQLDADGYPTAVAGCPPDFFSEDGQLWGNPLYDWDKMREDGYAWWVKRLQAASRMYDVVRLDHFRGFESYWAVPAGDKTAAGGAWQKGPGMDFVCAVQNALPELDFIAEDLGLITPEVRKLLKDSRFPGMKVLQFAFDAQGESDYLPHRHIENSVCYTGTHDNYTLLQWFEETPPEDVAFAKKYLGLNAEEGYVRGMIRGCMASVSELCMVQMQDYLELGAFARMNFPGTQSDHNWTWRVQKGFITEELTKGIYDTTRRYGRI